MGNEELDSVMSLISHRGVYLVYGKHSSFGAGTLVPMSRVFNTYSFSAPSVTLDKNTLYEYYFQVGTDGYFAEGNVGDIARLAPGFYRFLFTNTSDADTLDYYYYAENSTIGAFLPARANKEFYRIPVTPSMGVDQAIVDNNRVFYNKNTQSIKFVLADETESIQIFSVSGQLLQTVYPSDLHFEVSTNQIAPQMVIVQMIQNNNIISKKIMII